MPDTIERTIYKLELDGSAYIDGADKLAVSTTKLSKAQEEANVKLNQLKETTRLLKEGIKNYNAELKENEKRVASVNAFLKLQNSLSSKNKEEIAKSTAELAKYTKISDDLRSKISASNIALTTNTDLIKKQNTVLKDAGKASNDFTAGLKNVYGGLGRIANIIPGLGIAGLVGIIAGPLVNAFRSWLTELTAAEKKQKILKDITDNAIKSFTGEITHLGFIKDKLNDLNIPQEKRIALAKDYNKTAEEGNRIDLKQIDNIDLLNAAIDRQIQKIKERAFAKAAENIVTEKAEALFLAQSNLESKFPEQSNKIIKEITDRAEAAIKDSQKRLAIPGKISVQELMAVADIPEAELRKMVDRNKRFAIMLDTRTADIVRSAARELKAIEQYRGGAKAGGAGVSIAQAIIDQAQEDLDIALEAAKGFISIEGLFTDKSHAAGTKIVNIYEQELQRIRTEIAKLDEKSFTSVATITKALDEDFKMRSAAFDKALEKGQLTPEQVGKLNKKLAELKELVLTQSIKVFNQQRAALLEKIDSELTAIETESALKRVANIQDGFERQRQAIIAGSDKLINDRKNTTDKQIAEIKKSKILTPEEIQKAVTNVNTAIDDFILQVKIHTAQQLQQLSFDTFEKISEDLQNTLKDQNFDVSALALIDIQKQTELYQQGKISYKQYQKELTRIADEESGKRRDNEIANLRIEVGRRQSELRSNKNLTQSQQEILLKKIRSLEAQIDALERERGKTKPPLKDDDRIGKLVKYTQAIGDLTTQIISFWQKANDAESAALDRSIALQEKRVDAAQRIAERGNAQYLKAEEDRLKELQIKRENAARKQLGIDAALQASQILVGITGAIAKIATPGIGVAETIGAIAIIVGALATGYGLVKSLQGNQPTFFTGTKDTGHGGKDDGKGGFTATLHPNEAIIPADRNKAYKPAIAAIYDRTVPAEHLNAFVKNYHQIKSIPLPDYGRIKDSAELSIGRDGRMHLAINEQNKLIIENNDLQRATLKALKTIGVSVNMDKNGFAMSIMEVAEQIKINSRV